MERQSTHVEYSHTILAVLQYVVYRLSSAINYAYYSTEVLRTDTVIMSVCSAWVIHHHLREFGMDNCSNKEILVLPNHVR